jgi:hypothetical protein
MPSPRLPRRTVCTDIVPGVRYVQYRRWIEADPIGWIRNRRDLKERVPLRFPFPPDPRGGVIAKYRLRWSPKTGQGATSTVSPGNGRLAGGEAWPVKGRTEFQREGGAGGGGGGRHVAEISSRFGVHASQMRGGFSPTVENASASNLYAMPDDGTKPARESLIYSQ